MNEIQNAADPRKVRYAVRVCRDKKLMLTFIGFDTRVRHPRTTFNMFMIGLLLVVLPSQIDGMKLPGMIVSYVMGALIIAMSLFRKYITLSMMRNNPDSGEGEEITYLFGNTGIRSEKGNRTEELGHYKDVYKIWEDEKNYFLGMESEDLLVLPKNCFAEGSVSEFKEFIREKTAAPYRWQPARLDNIIKQTILGLRTSIMNGGLSLRNKRNKEE